MFVYILIINICYHDNLYACKGTRRVLLFYATCRSAISWEVPVLNQCTSDKKMLIFNYISLVSLCLFSMHTAFTADYVLGISIYIHDIVESFKSLLDTSAIRGENIKHSEYKKGTSPTTGVARPVCTTVAFNEAHDFALILIVHSVYYRDQWLADNQPPAYQPECT